jgi:hypothetical protein
VTAKLMTLGIGNTENSEQLEKDRFRYTKKLFKLAITWLKSFGNFGGIHREKIG